jgi:hypothetical protein
MERVRHQTPYGCPQNYESLAKKLHPEAFEFVAGVFLLMSQASHSSCCPGNLPLDSLMK